ncbi:YigZ family protein [Fodinicola acaciae]|uniref:YigZ family protein n=1 Tax=Fodinicola acaciae TaxID=2681555 RepID=UPI001C9E3B74|nr:YigZ family protein [Fodinicola acaciae]
MDILTVSAAVDVETEVRKSRFLCLLVPVGDEPAARAVIAARRREHHAARHHCSAFIAGPVQRSSDDGEPAGTAGAPMLEVLRGRQLTDVVAVVTRYFGGVLLGTGGLIRAYGGAVSAAVDAATVVRRRAMHTVTVTTDHVWAGRLENDLRSSPYTVDGVDYGADVRIEVFVAPEDIHVFTAWLAEHAPAATMSVGEMSFRAI